MGNRKQPTPLPPDAVKPDPPPAPPRPVDRTTRLTDLFIHLIGHKSYAGYVVALVDGKTLSITCLVCGLTSFNPTDVAEKYCGACHRFHEDLLSRGTSETSQTPKSQT